MYSSRGFREWEIGDIDVVRRADQYHLFHLVLPNHDYIAHAVSDDGMSWKRTRNALYTGEPGAWDDDMLWTMHVSRNPARKAFEMFYTGLHRAENGYIQRIGRAVSRDLMHWRKENEKNLPLAAGDLHYEVSGQSDRGWISFRDPYLFRHEKQDWLLLCARVPHGLVSRRGCVGLVRRTEESYVLEPPLFFPRVYDDVECPCLVVLDGWFYLIGSIREDMEVLYWWSESFRGEYRSFRPNILLPKGNYAARTMQDGRHVLVFNFYIDGLNVETGARTLPPPKQLRRDSQGRLELVSYYRWEEKKRGSRALEREHFRPHLENPTADSGGEGSSLRFSSRCGHEVFTAPEDGGAWIWEGELRVIQQGRCGFVFGLDEQLNGYFISIDGSHGLASIKAWGSRPERIFQNYIYEDLQFAAFPPNPEGRYAFRLIRWGSYIELSLDGVVRLTLVDARFKGRTLGIYVESAEVALSAPILHSLESPVHDQA
jgi:beta-fructofuranosidase